ncbi:unnamed protein product [Phytomonas sp. EM1]|nr:unnamed protein product [Phytomonas sp. EM1]|eukprot:CCW65309.1 unnamed protein product [Phytomonas sp. isolate EM1]
MVNSNGNDVSLYDLHANSMDTIQKLRLAVHEQEVYVSQLEKHKTMRDRLLAQLNSALRRSNLDTSTNIEAATEDLLRELHKMGREICVGYGVHDNKLEFRSTNEDQILPAKSQHSSERNSSVLVFSDAVETQLSALTEDDQWLQGESPSLPVTVPIDTSLEACQSEEKVIKRQKKRRHRKGYQDVVKVENSSPKSVEILRCMKERDAKHREELFKGLDRVIAENPDAFSLASGITSKQPQWLTAWVEADAAHSGNSGERQVEEAEDYSDDFEDD